jgi:hypothetical protein
VFVCLRVHLWAVVKKVVLILDLKKSDNIFTNQAIVSFSRRYGN